MEKILTELCHEVNNYFWHKKIAGDFTISNGELNKTDLLNLQHGQFFRIVGSVFNDGVHQYPAYDLKDEEFNGSVWSMAVPQAVIDLANDIEAWKAKYESVDSPAMSPYSSESFGNYSYSKSSSGGSSTGIGGDSNTWKGAFASRLNRYRRLRGCP